MVLPPASGLLPSSALLLSYYSEIPKTTSTSTILPSLQSGIITVTHSLFGMDDQIASPNSEVDRISSLPDDIIIIILSNLFVEESAGSSILSKRWHKLWLRSPLIISDRSIIKNSCTYSSLIQEESRYSSWILNTLSHILNVHPGPIHACNFILPVWEENQQALGQILKALVQKGIQKLELACQNNIFEVPSFVLECKSLVEVELCGVRIPTTELRPDRKIFPNLRKLCLELCNVNQQFMSKLFASNSITKLKFCAYDLDCVIIESSSLQKLEFSTITVNDHDPPTKLVIKNAPNLECFRSYDLASSCKVVIFDAPKLKVLDFTSMKLLMLQLGNCRFSYHEEYLQVSGEMTYMPSIQYLDIVVDFNSRYEVKSVPYLLGCFPCLETLVVEMIGIEGDARSNFYGSDGDDDGGDDEEDDVIVNDENDDGEDDNDVIGFVTANEVIGFVAKTDDGLFLRCDDVECFSNHLKHVRLEYFSGCRSQLSFAKFIVTEAKVLETLTLVCDKRTNLEDYPMEAISLLLMAEGASKTLEVEFVNE